MCLQPHSVGVHLPEGGLVRPANIFAHNKLDQRSVKRLQNTSRQPLQCRQMLVSYLRSGFKWRILAGISH